MILARWIAWLAACALFLVSGAVAGCSGDEDIRDVWQTLPQSEEVLLNGSVAQIAAALAEQVELPGAFAWEWEEATDYVSDADHPLIEVSHGLIGERDRSADIRGIPPDLVAFIEEDRRVSMEEIDRVAVQGHRIVLLTVGPDDRPDAVCIRVAWLVDIRRVTGGGEDWERWWVKDATSLDACPQP